MSYVLPPWARWAALALFGLALYACGRLDGARIEGAKHLEYVAKQAIGEVKIVQAREKVVTRTEIKYRDRIKIVKEKGDEIIHYVPIYITADTDQRFPVPAGFVRVLNAAAVGDPAGAAAESDGEASGIAASEVGATVAQNYIECRKWRVQVIGWQEFYKDLKAAGHTIRGQ